MSLLLILEAEFLFIFEGSIIIHIGGNILFMG